MAHTNWNTVMKIEGNDQVQIGSGRVMGSKSKKPKSKPAKGKELPALAESEELEEIRKSHRTVTDRQLKDISTHTRKQWKPMLRYLGVEDEEIDAIKVDALGLGVPESMYQLLLSWKRDAGDRATVSRLLKALEKSDMKELWTHLKEHTGGH
ncbi:uncharacterized protein LOC121387470 isoform X2 [Gigantopelta aegis]|nr:uncharacterized protein LOC121387470 isoform X2 [Gigantopelta aegis]